jgi:glycyl-tRNA synthetase beta chain
MSTQNLLVELFVEELPPKALKKLGQAFASALAEQLKAQGLAAADAACSAFASPRRLAAHVSGVLAQAADKAVQQKLMPVSVGLDASGHATPALLKKLQALGADVSDPAAAVAALKRAPDGKAEALFYDSVVPGASLAAGLQKALDEGAGQAAHSQSHAVPARNRLRVAGLEQRELCAASAQPGRPAWQRGGAGQGLGLTAGNTTQGHRFEARFESWCCRTPTSTRQLLLSEGAVIASFADRRAEIVRQLQAAAARVGGGVRRLKTRRCSTK